MSRGSAWVGRLLVAVSMLAWAGCGDEVDRTAQGRSSVTKPPDTSAATEENALDWCSLYGGPLPALSPTPPAGRALEAVDRYIERYERLAVETEGVPRAATAAARRLAGAFAGIRERVRQGEELGTILETETQNPESVIFSAGEQIDDAARSFC